MSPTQHLIPSAACLLVSDFQRALAFYVDKLGMVPARVNKGFAYFGGVGAGLALWDMTQVEDALGYKSATSLDELQGTIIISELENRAAVDKMYQFLTERGVEFVRSPQLVYPETYAAIFADPDGNLWQLRAAIDGGSLGAKQ